MASGHANRAQRPNTWPHRPATRREDFPCQPGAVHTWHKAAVAGFPILRPDLVGTQSTWSVTIAGDEVRFTTAVSTAGTGVGLELVYKRAK
jgi:hypothetical protein